MGFDRYAVEIVLLLVRVSLEKPVLFHPDLEIDNFPFPTVRLLLEHF